MTRQHPPRPAAITPRQADVMRFVCRYTHAFEVAPTRAEIGRALGISRPTAEQHLQALRAAGLVCLATRWRGITITAKGARAAGGEG